MTVNLEKLIKKVKINWDDIATGFTFLAIAGGVVLVGVYLGGFAKFGLNSYNALTPEHIRAVYADFQRRYPVLSKVGGHNILGGYFERGVAGNGGILYYFHYTDNGKGKVTFSLYPEFFESWTTDPGFLGIGRYFTGSPIS